MNTICRYFYGTRRKWKKIIVYIMFGIITICLLFYLHLVNNIPWLEYGKILLSKESAKFNSSFFLRKTTLKLEKNLIHFQYSGGKRNEISEEKFLGLLASSNQMKNASILSNTIVSSTLSGTNTFTNPIQKKGDLTIYHSKYRTKKTSKRFLFILGHYEQLSKTLINLMHAGVLARKLNLSIVLPFVKNSRFCGLKGGFVGKPRVNTRQFLPIDNYFNLNSIEALFNTNRLANLVQFSDFQKHCKVATMVYFLYKNNRQELVKYFKLNENEVSDLEKKVARSSTGVVDCLHIEGKVKSGQRINSVKFNKAYCVVAERVDKVKNLSKLLGNSNCMVIFTWRGIGSGRTHLNLSLPVNSFDHYLAQINFSLSVTSEANDFIRESLQSKPYIGVQIRSERQLAWYGIDKFKNCIDQLIKIVRLLVYEKKIPNIFVSSDLEKHGSDSIGQLVNTTVITEAKIYLASSFRELPVKFFKPDKRRGLIHNDAGYVALSQLEILSRSKHLITLGAGTFQDWVKAKFRKNKGNPSEQWSITRVCSVEVKNQKRKRHIS